MQFTKVIERRAGSGDRSIPGLSPALSRVLAVRGIEGPADLTFSNRALLPPAGLADIDQAAKVIAGHVTGGSKILLVGDYDADGATSCALGVLALRRMGAAEVDYLVPDRFRYGYGLSAPLVDLAAQRNPGLLITVDNGIASIEGAGRARELGLDLVITDHHLPGPELPDAAAIVNPNLEGDGFPSKHLAGVGVIFYVLSVVRRRLDDDGWFRRRGVDVPSLADFLDLVALGTYADLVRLDANNRILVAQGIRRINARHCRQGIQALVEVSGREFGKLVAQDLGFQLAPRLNAAGRLDDMALGIECLLAEDAAEARRLAMKLDTINRERKSLEQQMQHQAVAALADDDTRATDAPGICLFHPEWHEGVVGLVASRLKERHALPAAVFARGEGGVLKGSARSVAGVHIRDILCEVDSAERGLLLRYGGHAMAAGMTIREQDFERFRTLFLDRLERHRDTIDAANRVLSDGPLGEELDDLAFIRQLRTLAPWGQGFPEPVFDNTFRVLDQRLVGDVHLKLLLSPDSHVDHRIEAICFRFLSHPGAACPAFERIHAAYRVDVNEFAGRVSPQLIIEYFNPL